MKTVKKGSTTEHMSAADRSISYSPDWANDLWRLSKSHPDEASTDIVTGEYHHMDVCNLYSLIGLASLATTYVQTSIPYGTTYIGNLSLSQQTVITRVHNENVRPIA